MSWLRDKRIEKGLTQLEVADDVGINRATLSKIENWVSRPSVRLAQKLGNALSFDWTRFYDETNEETTKEIKEGN